MNQTTHRRRRRRSNPLLPIIAILGAILLVLCIIAVSLPGMLDQPDPSGPAAGTTGTTSGTTAPTNGTTAPTGGITDPTDGTTAPTGGTTAPTDPTQGTTESTQGTTAPTNPEPVDLEAFFSETVFIGDSVTKALFNYCSRNSNALYGAKILSAGSYSVRHAITEPDPGNKNVISLTYQGVQMRPEDALAQIGAKRVFIMLGMNDIAFGVDYTMGNWQTLIDNIRAKCPDIEIYIQSGTPIHSTKDRNDSDGKGLSNGNMDIYNQRLEAFCKENNCYFVNLAPHFKDENGQLKDAYCSDPYNAQTNPNGQGCHFTDAGVKLWIQLLKDFVTNKK